MFEKNYDLQERADMLNTAADDLEGWEPEDDEPEQEEGELDNDFQDRYDEWLENARQSLSDAIDGMDLP